MDSLDAIDKLFSEDKPVIGTIHCPPLPSSPAYSGQDINSIIDYCVKEAGNYLDGGVDGLIVENACDTPYVKPEEIGPETVSSMTVISKEISSNFDATLGVVINWNAAKASLAVAKSVKADFVRVNQWVNAYVSNSGIIEGKSGEVMRYRSKIFGKEVKIFADVHVKHGSHAIVSDRSLSDQAADVEFFNADTAIATGTKTGSPPSASELREIRNGTDLPVLVGSGLTAKNSEELIPLSDGAIVGTSLKKDNKWKNPVVPEKVKKLMKKVKSLRT